MARGVVALNRRWVAGGLCLVILFLTMPRLQRYYRTQQKEQWDRVARLVEHQGRPGDLVVLSWYRLDIPFTYYYRGSLDRFSVNGDDIAEATRKLRAAIVGHRRVWFIASHVRNHPTGLNALKILLPPRGTIASYKFVGVWVLLYEIPPHLRGT